MSVDKVLQALRLSYVPRWGIVPVLRPQSVAEHTYRVMVIVRYLAKVMNMSDSLTAKVVVEALEHDFEEHATGDTPSPAKKAHSPQAPLVKLADTIEAYLWLATWGSKGERIAQIVADLDYKVRWLAAELDLVTAVNNLTTAVLKKGE